MKEPPSQEFITDWLFFLDSYAVALQAHHHLEERILFRQLHELPQLNQGGPRCTHFMGLLILDNPTESLRETLRVPILTPHIPPDLVPFFASQSPLRIPLEEHIVGHLALKEIQCRIAESESGPSLRGLIHEYARLMDTHISKEDTCLFVRAHALLEKLSSGIAPAPDLLKASLLTFDQAAIAADETMGRLLEFSLR